MNILTGCTIWINLKSRKRLSRRRDKLVSLKDIANHCGVSVATVSKVLNGHSDIGDTTRQRVLDAAAQMGYTANAAARALKTNRSYNLGIVFFDLQNSGFMHEYFASMLNSFRIEAAEYGYDICFINANVRHRNHTYLQHALYRGVDGVALICADFKDPGVQELANSNMPVVTLDHAFNNRTAVLSDNVNGMKSLVHYVYEMGHRKIAYIHGNDTAVTENRMIGFYNACEELELSIPNEYIKGCEYHEPNSCYEATNELLALDEIPSCILCSDDYALIGSLKAIAEAGLKVPEDISIVGYDGIQMAKVMSPRLTTWEQNTMDLGRIAAEKLIERIEKPRTAIPEHIVVNGRLLEGETVRRLAQ